MAYIRFKTAAFGLANGSLATVGYELYNPDGSANGSRITTGVAERGTGSGVYGASVSFPDGFVGEIRWDTGGVTVLFAAEEVNPSPFEKGLIDFTQAVPTSNTAQSIGDCLNAARAQGFGKWVLSGTTLTLYAADGVTGLRAFTLDNSTSPTIRS